MVDSLKSRAYGQQAPSKLCFDSGVAAHFLAWPLHNSFSGCNELSLTNNMVYSPSHVRLAPESSVDPFGQITHKHECTDIGCDPGPRDHWSMIGRFQVVENLI